MKADISIQLENGDHLLIKNADPELKAGVLIGGQTEYQTRYFPPGMLTDIIVAFQDGTGNFEPGAVSCLAYLDWVRDMNEQPVNV